MAPFNWFKRQYSGSSDKSNDKPAETPPPEETAPEPTSEEAAPAIAEDYLSWAKAAYQNIQKRQQTPEEASAAETTETAEPEAAPPEPESPAAVPEPVAETTPESTETGSGPSEAPEPIAEAEAAPVETAPEEAEETATSEPEAASPEMDRVAIAAEAEVEASGAISVPDPLLEPESTAEPAVSPGVAAEQLAPETAPASGPEPEPEPATAETPEPVPSEAAESVDEVSGSDSPSETPAEAPEAQEPAAPLPFWAQAEAERQARLERLKAEAEAEAQAEEAARQPVATTQSAAEAIAAPDTGIVFDESFLWSAEVLAAQGRRPEEISVEEITWLKRLRQGLDKTRRGLINQLRSIVGQGPLNEEAVMEIESLLLQADVGIVATDYIIEALQAKLRQEALPPSEAIAYLKKILRDMLDNPMGKPYDPTFAPEKDALNVWLMTGVNGAGKTTTIGKIAHIAKKSGYSCLIAAADTFRAAAVEQVKIWGGRSNVDVISNPGKNTDPAAVVYDAIAAAQARQTELLLVDTAGRLQNKKNLMEELSKIRRIIDKKAPDAKVESLLVLDATLGQNGLRQAEVFAEAAKLSGVVLTKLDGTARGGIALAIVQQLGLPIRFIGAGEGIEDLRPFSSYEFVEALLNG